ncbi:class I SAM-dependent methyltransferase [Thermaurantiacus sp.]
MKETDYLKIFEHTDYVLCACENCGATFQKLIPDPELAAAIYGEWIVSHDPGLGQRSLEDARRMLAEALTLVAHTLSSTGKTRPSQLAVLDFGAGTGSMSVALKAAGCRVFAYDFAKERQALGAELGISMLAMEDIGPQTFDLIHTEQVFEHLPDPVGTGRILAGGLSRNGILKLSVPYDPWFERGKKGIDWSAGKTDRCSWMPNQPLEHLQYMPGHCLEKFGNMLGLAPSHIPSSVHLRYASGWTSPKNVAANIGKAMFLHRLRNYRLFRKA